METSLAAYDTRPIPRLVQAFMRFIQLESTSSIILFLATVAALYIANSRFASSYEALLQIPLGVSIGQKNFSWPLHNWVNDALMALFFLVVGLEVKREFLIGELASFRRAFLPVLAALGGVLFPATIYLIGNRSGPEVRGWGVPIATDIAFSLAILIAFGSRIPFALRIFLASLAIVDDIAGVLVIATTYTRQLHLGMLCLAAALFLACLALNWGGVTRVRIYLFVGAVLWWALHASGVHATLAGIIVALAIPSRIDPVEGLAQRGHLRLEQFKKALHTCSPDSHKSGVDQMSSPLDRLQANLHPWVSFGIMPVFALTNAGIPLHGFQFSAVLQPEFAGIALGLLLGKPLGITAFSWLAVRLHLAELPRGVTWKQLHAVSWLGGIGFTVAIFIAGLAFENREQYTQARIAILLTSVCAAMVGTTLLTITHLRYRDDIKRSKVIEAQN